MIKLGFNAGASVESLLVMRMAFSLPLIVGILIYSVRSRRHQHISALDYAKAGGLGVVSYYICAWLDFTGLQYITSQLERLILFVYPTLTAILAWIFLGDKMSWRHGMALTFSYGGIAILFGRELEVSGDDVWIGAGLVFLCAILFAMFVVASKPVLRRVGSSIFTSVAMLGASVAIFAHAFIKANGVITVETDPTILGLGAFLGLACTILPGVMTAEAIDRMGPGPASAVGTIGPVSTAIIAVFVLHEPFGWPQASALALSITGIIILFRARPPQKPKSPSAV